jgi:pimeloyl-ACP methyl ester carboxylesterase
MGEDGHMPALTQLPEDEREVAAPGGRRLSYARYGAPDGAVVVVLDGPGSRGMARAAAPVAETLGLRLVAPDRPGFFHRAPAPDSTIGDWPEDHVALLDALGCERAGIIAQSGGTPFALAAAVAAPARVTAVALVSPLGPLEDPANLADAGSELRAGARLSRRAPWLLRLMLRMAARRTRANPERTAASVAKDPPPADAEVLRDPAIAALHVRSTAEIFSRPDALAHELGLVARPWGIELGACRVPVAIWSGERDVVHPPSHARRLAAALGGAPVTVVEGAATFGMLPVYGDALRFAAGGEAAGETAG